MTLTSKRAAAVGASGLAVVAVLVGGVLFGGGGESNVVAGLPTAGPEVEYGLAFLELAGNLLGVVAVGALLGALLTHEVVRSDRTVRRRYLVTASNASALWLLMVLLQIVFSYSEFSARPLAQAFDIGELMDFVDAVSQARALVIQALLASFLAAVCIRLRSIGAVGAALVLATITLLPPALTGHSASAGNHLLGISTLTLHVVAATYWLGGVAVLTVMAASRFPKSSLSTTANRFSALALWCFVSVALSGIANAALRVHAPSDLFTTHYGVLVLVKVTAFVAVGYLGWRHRKVTLAALSAGAERAFLKLIAVEALVLTSAFAVAVALSRTSPPNDPDAAVASRARELLGYDMPPAPDVMRLLTQFQPDGFAIIAAVFAMALYAVGIRRLQASGRTWPVRSTAAWIGGWAMVVFVTSGGIGVYSGVLFSAHMAQHMILNMLAPILLVLGEPVRLAIRALPRSKDSGPKEWLVAALRSKTANFLTNGLVAGAIFVASLWLLYFTPLFQLAMNNHYGHVLMQVHFIAAGFLFFYVMIGRDTSAKRFPYPARLGLLVITMISHAFFGLALMSSSSVIAESYYAYLQRPWGTSLLTDQRTGAGIAWGFGELPMTVVLAVLFSRWVKSEERAAANEDYERVHSA